MSKTICIFNQKGGVGKTTTAVNVCAALGKQKKKVLMVDMDPQGNATSGLGVEKLREDTIYELILGQCSFEEALVKSNAKNVDTLPSNNRLSGLEIELVSMENRERLLKKVLEPVAKQYDFIMIDCPPSLGLLSINALSASDSVIIPIQCEYYALEGVSQLVETIGLVKKGLNSALEIEGVVLSMFDGRNNLALEVVEEVKKYFKDKVYKTVIPRNIRLAEAPSYGMNVLDYDEKSKGAIAYTKLAKEIIRENR